MKKVRFGVVLGVVALMVAGAGVLSAGWYLVKKVRGDTPAPAVYSPPPDPSETNIHVRFRENDLLNYDRSLGDLLGTQLDKNKVTLLVEKSEYRLTVLYDGQPVKQYPVVLGGNPVDDKLREGDGCTPEGCFIIKELYPHNGFYRFLWIDYPNEDSWRKHDQAIADGEIPAGSGIGGEIGIHGESDKDIDHQVNCTAGCVALKKWDVGEIYEVCREGTVVEIRR